MVHYDALSASDKRKYFEGVSQTHHRRVELVILTKNDKPVRSLTNRFLGGGVHGDDTRTPVEVLDTNILDDDYVLDWHHGQHRKFKAQVIDHRYIDSLDDWVEKVIFTGPLWDFERKGPEVSLAAQGSERLAMGTSRRVLYWPRKAKATTVGKALLKAAGAPDRGLKIPRRQARLPESVTVGVPYGKKVDGKDKDKKADHFRTKQKLKVTREDTFWGKAAPIFRALDLDLFSDFLGRFVAAPPPTKPTAKLTNRHILSPVTEKRGDEGDKPNTWYVLGANPKGPKERVKATVALPKKHPLSAEQQAWHGTPYEVSVTVENRHLRRNADAIRLGVRMRDRAMRELVTYEIEALPVIPWIRPGALVSVPTGNGGRAAARIHQWTLPLGPGADPLTLGANRRAGWR
jgi:hypothetical protein